MRKGFTLIELLVAVSIMALMIVFAGIVFRVSIDMYRVSAATAEIMQKLRTVTDQLDADFKGLRRDAPLLIWFEQRTSNDPNRYDQIMFFADGDFSSIQLYQDVINGQPKPDGTRVIRGNTARVFYGQAQKFNPVKNIWQDPWDQEDKNGRKTLKERVLARRQHILTDDQNVDNWPQLVGSNFTLTGFGDSYSDPDGKQQVKEERYEHDKLSLAQWKIIDGSNYDVGGSVIDKSFNTRPTIDTSTNDPRTFHKLFCPGVGSFAIQWAYWDNPAGGSERLYWFPSADPDGSGDISKSHFTLNKNRFGVYFNISGDITDWFTVGNITRPVIYRQGGQAFPAKFFPAALKFTFTLYDSKGVIKDGMTFSHIVYLEQ